MVFINIDKSNYNKDPNTNKNPIVKLNDYLHNKRVFILIYMEGCGPCNSTRPEWSKIKNILKNYQNNDNVAIVDIDKDLLDKLKYIDINPSGFPTIKYINNKDKIIEDYENSNIKTKDRTIDSFIDWIISKENIEKYSVNKANRQTGGKTKRKTGGKWSKKYKRSINCSRPKGFSQKQYCKYGRKKIKN
jgi:thiol-disulfide isomerase/thioredoxin